MFIPLIINLGFIGIGGLFLKTGLKYLNLYHKIRNLATSKIKSLAAGEVEIKGKIIPNQNPLITPVSKVRCVSYLLTASKYRPGKNSNWETIFIKIVSRPFYLGDDTGYILVDPKDAKIITQSRSYIITKEFPPELIKDVESIINTAKKAKSLRKWFSKALKSKKFKLEEIYLPEGKNIYILGYTRENPKIINHPNVQRLMIAKKHNKDYIISDEKEEDLQRSYKLIAIILTFLALFLIFFGLIQVFNIVDWINFMEGLY